MKLVTYETMGRSEPRCGVLLNDAVLDLARLIEWARRERVDLPDAADSAPWPTSALGLLRLEEAGIAAARAALAAAARARPDDLSAEPGLATPLSAVRLRTPVPDPPTIRDFYAFEQHVKAARARRNLGMTPEWYETAVFYFSNTSALYGADEPIVYPRQSQELDFELEMAAIIGRTGRDIPAEEGPSYIAGDMGMHGWSPRALPPHDLTFTRAPPPGQDLASCTLPR